MGNPTVRPTHGLPRETRRCNRHERTAIRQSSSCTFFGQKGLANDTISFKFLTHISSVRSVLFATKSRGTDPVPVSSSTLSLMNWTFSNETRLVTSYTIMYPWARAAFVGMREYSSWNGTRKTPHGVLPKLELAPAPMRSRHSRKITKGMQLHPRLECQATCSRQADADGPVGCHRGRQGHLSTKHNMYALVRRCQKFQR